MRLVPEEQLVKDEWAELEEVEYAEVRAEEERLNEYEVESILQKRQLRRSSRLGEGKALVKYLVKWKYWGDEEATWERAEDVVKGAPELVEEFERREALQKEGRRG